MIAETCPKAYKGDVFDQNTRIEDVCIIKDTGAVESWSLGRIIELLPNDQDHVRLVRLKFKLGEIIRSIKHFYPLEEGNKELKIQYLQESDMSNTDNTKMSPFNL